MRRSVLVLVVVAFVVAAGDPAAADPSATSRHLLAGVRAFKAEQYEQALVELRVVAAAPDAPSDLAYYLGPTLFKLGRYREALVTFVRSPAAADALTDFYLGQTYYQLRMYRKARAVFAGLRGHGLGPVLDEAAGRYVDAVDLVYATPPSPSTIDVYLDEAGASAEPVVAGEWLDEARQVEALATARHRHDEIAGALGVTWNAQHMEGRVIAALGGDPAAGPEGAWQLARAYAGVHDLPHALAALAAITAQHGAHAADAARLLSSLSSPQP